MKTSKFQSERVLKSQTLSAPFACKRPCSGARHVWAEMGLALLVVPALVFGGCSSKKADLNVESETGSSGASEERLDSDLDGLSNREEGAFAEGGAEDSDGDGIPNFLDTDSDNDGLSDRYEGLSDHDGDGVKGFVDPVNNGDIPLLNLTSISTDFRKPIGIDHHEPTNTVIMTTNYPEGEPFNFERIDADGVHYPFSNMKGLKREVKIATIPNDHISGFKKGELFVGNGEDGQIARISADGEAVVNPWVDLPGSDNGLMRGGLIFDSTGVFGNELIAVTNKGQIWRVSADGEPTLLVKISGVHLEGVAVVPDLPRRYGPLAGKIITGDESLGVLYAISKEGKFEIFPVGVHIEDIDIISPQKNFFGVNYGTSRLLGAAVDNFIGLEGDILLTQEYPEKGTGLAVLRFNGNELETKPVRITEESAIPGQWEHVTFSRAGIAELPPIE